MFGFCLKIVNFLIFKLIIFITIISILPLNITAQTKLRYQAEQLVGSENEEGKIRDYTGNVIILQDDIRITCEYARQFIENNNALLRKNVNVYQGDMTMTSQEMTYDGNNKIAKSKKTIEITDKGTYLVAKKGTYYVNERLADFNGDVFIENDTTVILSDKVKFYRDTDISLAYGNANIKSKTDNVYLLGDTVENYPQKSYSIVKGKTNLIQVDTSRYASDGVIDTLKISCDTIESFRAEDEVYYFRNNVKIERDIINATSDLAKYDRVNDEIIFYGNPIIWYDNFQLYGDTIIINTKGNELEKIRAYGNAISVNQDTLFQDRFNQIAGKFIEINFSNKEIKKITSEGVSKSLYFMIDEGSPEGADLKSANKIEILFKNGEAENINWIGEPNGYYIPEQILYNSIDKYNLQNLRWKEERPKIEMREVKIK